MRCDDVKFRRIAGPGVGEECSAPAAAGAGVRGEARGRVWLRPLTVAVLGSALVHATIMMCAAVLRPRGDVPSRESAGVLAEIDLSSSLETQPFPTVDDVDRSVTAATVEQPLKADAAERATEAEPTEPEVQSAVAAAPARWDAFQLVVPDHRPTDAALAPRQPLKEPADGAGSRGAVEPTAEPVKAETDVNEVRFAGLAAGRSGSIVYVVDGSGPMVTSLPRVLQEVRRSVASLAGGQRFGVVIFRSGPAGAGTAALSPDLLAANAATRDELDRWLAEIAPGGRSDPLAGLETALSLRPRPETIFLLSRSIHRSAGGSWAEGLNATMARLDELNPRSIETGRRAVIIRTIQFLDDDPTGIMQAIGRVHGGADGPDAEPGYRVIRRTEDLDRRGTAVWVERER